MELKLKVSPLFPKNYNATEKIIVNQGGTRSTKTYSILQCLIVIAHEVKNETFSIFRKELSTLKVTAYRDFIDILKSYEIYNEQNHNKSDLTYELNGNLFEFQGLDKPTKKRGAKRYIGFINEANELTYEDFKQIILRTTHKLYLDYNPSDEFHWIYDNVITRNDCLFIQSTYKDNPFLEQTVIEEIERLKDEDENYWRIFGLGERGMSVQKIYSNWIIENNFPETFDETIYGIDFGFNNPMALVEVSFKDGEPFIKELLYKKHLLTRDLIEVMNEKIINKQNEIFPDNAEPDRIREIEDAGFNIIEIDKSVLAGIRYCKSMKLHIHPQSSNLIKELKSYSWKLDKNGSVLEEPIKVNDHLCDAFRYAIYNYSKAMDFSIRFV